MTKIITISIILLCGITVSTSSANASVSNACTNAGHTVGAACGSSSDSGTGTSEITNVITESACINPNVSCKYAVCDGICRCAPDGACSDFPIITDKAPCATTPTWETSSQLCLETGTCQNSAGKTITVYRCADRCYLDSDEDISSLYGYTTSSITCTACPSYPDDKISYMNKLPSYVTTGGAGLKKISKCQIKANAYIQDRKGTFVFPTACSYTE